MSLIQTSTWLDPIGQHMRESHSSHSARHVVAGCRLSRQGTWLIASVNPLPLVRPVPSRTFFCSWVPISRTKRNQYRRNAGQSHVLRLRPSLYGTRKTIHLMPLTLGAASLLGRVPPRPPRVWLPPRVDGAGTRDVLGFGAGVWNFGAAVLDEDGLSTKDVSVVLEARSFSFG